MKNVVCLSSGGPGNFATVMEFCEINVGIARVVHLITDRPAIPSIELAESKGIPYSVVKFRNISPSSKEFRKVRTEDCEQILSILNLLESTTGSISLVVSAFRRILLGEVIERLKGRLINVHPADLTVIDPRSGKRRYVGIGGLARSIRDGRSATRTTIHFIDDGIDTGSVLCLGPEVPVIQGMSVSDHESRQKRESDRPALMNALQRLLISNTYS